MLPTIRNYARGAFGHFEAALSGAFARDLSDDTTITGWFKLRYAGQAFTPSALVGEQPLLSTQASAFTDQGWSLSVEDDTVRVRLVGAGAGQTLTATQVVTENIDGGGWVFYAVVRAGKTITFYLGEAGETLSTYDSPTVVEGADPLDVEADSIVPASGNAVLFPLTHGANCDRRFVADLAVWDRALDATQVANVFAGATAV
jgi:hypothetical protein